VSEFRRFALSACAGLLALFALSHAKAEAPEACQGSDLTQIEGLAAAKAARADDLINGEGLLWRIEKPGLAPSFLFGTIHSTDESALEVARRAARLISGSKTVATELGGPIGTIEKATSRRRPSPRRWTASMTRSRTSSRRRTANESRSVSGISDIPSSSRIT